MFPNRVKLNKSRASARMAIIGGSSAAYHSTITATTEDLDGRGALVWANMRSKIGGSLQFTNYGVAGAVSADVVAAQLPSITYDAFDYVAILNGGNDIINSVAYATIINNFTTMINHIIDAGAIPIVFTISPSSAFSPTAAQIALYNKVNRWILNIPRMFKNAYAYGYHSKLVAPASTTHAYITGYTYDNTHTSHLGAFAVSDDLATFLTTVLGVPKQHYPIDSILDTWTNCGAAVGDGVNRLDTVTWLAGTAGLKANLNGTNPCVFTGDAPGTDANDRLNVYADSLGIAGMACTITTGTDTDGIPYADFAMTIGAAGQYLVIAVPTVHTRVANGEYCEAVAEIKITGGTTRPEEVALLLSYASDQSIRSSIGVLTSAGTAGINADETFYLHTPLKQYLTSYGVAQSLVRVKARTTGTYTIRLKRPALIGYTAEF